MPEPRTYPPMSREENDALRTWVQHLLLAACSEMYRQDPRVVVDKLLADLAIVMIGPKEMR